MSRIKLSGLNPQFISTEDQDGVGIIFNCPCGCARRIGASFKKPLKGKNQNPKGWDRTGDTFDNLTLKPSIRVIGHCGWHGYIENGEVRTV